MSELDHILLDQLISARRRLARIRRMKLLMRDPKLSIAEHMTHGHIQFFESMITDKTLIKKRRKRPRKEKDILYRNPIIVYYRNTYMMMSLTFGILTYYITLWYKKER